MKRLPSAAHELPQDLPQGEHVLWQGAPGFWPLLKSLHGRWLLAYFGALLVAVAVHRALFMPATLASAMLRFTALSLVVIGLHAGYVLLVCRTTSYTITTRRFVLQAGIALPVSVNIPWSKVQTARLRAAKDGSGNIVLAVAPAANARERPSTILLWPHTVGGKEGALPMLRAVPNVQRVAKLLRRQLEATEAEPATPASAPPQAARGLDAAPRPALGQAPGRMAVI